MLEFKIFQNYNQIYFIHQILGAIRTICQGKQNEQLLIGTTHNSLLSGDFENVRR